jgi:V/A-type H+-transporting ATPase subunit D
MDMGTTKVDAIALSTPSVLEVDIKLHRMMDVQVPSLQIRREPKPARYGLGDTSPHLDETIKRISGVLADIVKAAELENSIFRIAAELERTQRLINALEYIIIPSYEEAIKYISMVLEEREREEFVRLKKLKASLEKRKAARS